MSFLVEDEEQATLAEALAFIDTFAQDEPAAPSSSNNNNAPLKAPSASDNALYVELRIPKSLEPQHHDASSSGHTSGTDSSTSSNAADALSEEQLKKLRARAANTRAVHRYRKRTKTEIVTLREQVEQLDSQLTALRKRTVAVRGSASTTAELPLQVSASSLTALTTVVATELRKRQASEALNRRLKEALAKQRKVSAALESVFKKQALAPELSFVLDMDKLLPAPLAAAAPAHVPVATAASDDERVYAELYRYLEDTVYAQTPAISALLARSDVDCVFNNTLIKHDARVGKMFEFLSNTPVAGSREQLTAKLWMFLTFPIGPNEAAEDPFANVRMCYEQSSTVRGQVGMKFDCDLGDVTATGVSAFRQFVEPHRTVLTFASLLSVPGSTLLFRESAWLILSDAAAAGCTSAPTLFQTAYRLHAEPSKTRPDDASATTESHATNATSSSLVDSVLSRKGERMRGFLMMIQNRLLNGLRELRLDDFLPKCRRLCPCSA